ncbi:MAG: serine/threonine-protein kinase [Pseudomonadota bacterium]
MKTDLLCPRCGRKYPAPTDRCDVDGSPLLGPEVRARLGKQVGSYQILEILGEGGMAVVYKAEHILLRKPVAIKFLHQRLAQREGTPDKFLQEAQAATHVRHPNIIDITDFGIAPDGCHYFVMEYLEGESLEDVLERDVRLPLFNAVNVIRQIANALAFVHDLGLVHGDLKPENIFLIRREGKRRIVRRQRQNSDSAQFIVEPEGDFDFVKLLDFGAAKYSADNTGPGTRPGTGMVFGTPHYMSPEQALGEPMDGRSDVYSLGLLFYELLTGEVPFDAECATDILNSHVSDPVVPPKDRLPDVEIDDGTNETILKSLEKSREHRFQSMDEFCRALDNCFTDRVFLRNADRMPGAVESGIVPPKVNRSNQSGK